MKIILKSFYCMCLIFIITTCDNKSKKHNPYTQGDLKNTTLGRLKQNNPQKRKLDSIYSFLSLQKNDLTKRLSYINLANNYFDNNNYEEYYKVTNDLYNLSLKAKDSSHIAKSLYYIGDYYETIPKLDSALVYYLKSEKIYKRLNDSLNTGKTALYKANIFYSIGNFTEGEIAAIQALKYLPKALSSRQSYEANRVLALCLKEMKLYNQSLIYLNNAISELDNLKAESSEKINYSKAFCYNDKGTIYQAQKNYKQAINEYQKGIKIELLKENKPILFATILNNLGYSKMKLGKLNEAENLFFESLKIQDSLKVIPGIIGSKIYLGEYYLQKKDTAIAIAYMNEAYGLSKQINFGDEIIYTLKFLINNDLKNKTKLSAEYFRISDSVREAERLTKNKFARIAYETDQIEEKNVVLSKRNKYLIFMALLFFSFIVTVILIHRLKSKNKELLFNKEQQEANEQIYQLMLKQQSESDKVRTEERNRIAMELHDGIVNSIFTTRFNLAQLEPHQSHKKEQLVLELEKAEKQIRMVSHDLTQNLFFEDKNLPEIIINLVESQENHFNTKFDVTIDKYINWTMVSSENKIHIYRIIQEALQNINKYSIAIKCYIMLLKTGDKITIRIWDNGVGFNPETVKRGIGLKNINERVKALNGELKISSNTGNGTTIEIIF